MVLDIALISYACAWMENVACTAAHDQTILREWRYYRADSALALGLDFGQPVLRRDRNER